MHPASRANTSTRLGVLVAASHSGAGKTTVVSTLLRAFESRGLSVQAFKIGPDFIDTAYHSEATGRPAINLDLWMMGPEAIEQSFTTYAAAADVSVVESMGALFDGVDGTDDGSAADLAKRLGLPVVVVLDVWGMTRTTGAIIEGLRSFDTTLEVAGVILNRVGSPTHARLILDSLAPALRRLVLGTIPYRPGLDIPERHLGLLTVEENPGTKTGRDEAYRVAAESLDIDRLLEAVTLPASPAAHQPPPSKASGTASTPEGGTAQRARLAIARDPAFCFYYEDNLRGLEEAGFELVPFRPLADASLPAGTDAVYLGGGYPESFAEELAANTALASDLRRAAAAGMPIYAECGGQMYLGRSLTGYDGRQHQMAGVLPIDVVMDPEHLSIRYVEVRTRVASLLGPAGTRLRGQEFHQSRITVGQPSADLFSVTSSAGDTSTAGLVEGAVVASYIHAHFASNPEVPRHFHGAALAARNQRA